MAGELEWRSDEWDRTLVARHSGQPLAAADAFRQLFTAFLQEERLLVKQVELRGTTRLKQVDHSLGPRRDVKAVEGSPMGAGLQRQRGRRAGSRAAEQVGEREAAEAQSKPVEPLAAIERKLPHRFTTTSS